MIRKQRLKEIEENNKRLGILPIEENEIRKDEVKVPLQSIENLQNIRNSSRLSSTKSPPLSLAKKLANQPESLSDTPTSLIVPIIEITSPQEIIHFEYSKSQQELLMEISKRNTKSGTLAPLRRASQRLSNRTSIACDTKENSMPKPVIHQLPKKTKKTVTINAVPEIEDVSISSSGSLSHQSRNSIQISSRSSESIVKLNSGKWRRSLIRLRHSINPDSLYEDRMVSRGSSEHRSISRASTLFPPIRPSESQKTTLLPICECEFFYRFFDFQNILTMRLGSRQKRQNLQNCNWVLFENIIFAKRSLNYA